MYVVWVMGARSYRGSPLLAPPPLPYVSTVLGAAASEMSLLASGIGSKYRLGVRFCSSVSLITIKPHNLY